MKQALAILLSNILLASCSTAQEPNPQLVGGPCEGCEAIFEFKDKTLTSVDTLPDFKNEGTQLKISGTVYQSGGRKPAENVILYVYHTNQDGVYANDENEGGWARHHGSIRGWVKTGKDGKYSFYTLKPAAYPQGSIPAHIHITVLEPNGKYYWLGSYHFEGDSLLTEKEINPTSPRGGSSGLLKLRKAEGLMLGTRDIVLGENVPAYD